MPLTRRTLPLLLAVLATATVPATALAKHGDDDGPGDDRGGDRQEQSDDSRGRGGDDSGSDDSSGRGRGGDDDDSRGDDSGSGRGGDDDGGNGRRDRREIRVAGRCDAGSTAKLKVKNDDGRLEAEFEVDQNRNGVTWTVQIRRNGAVAVSTRATTRAPSGSFSVERKITNGPGADRVTARATSPSGEVCTAATTF